MAVPNTKQESVIVVLAIILIAAAAVVAVVAYNNFAQKRHRALCLSPANNGLWREGIVTPDGRRVEYTLVVARKVEFNNPGRLVPVLETMYTSRRTVSLDDGLLRYELVLSERSWSMDRHLPLLRSFLGARQKYLTSFGRGKGSMLAMDVFEHAQRVTVVPYQSCQHFPPEDFQLELIGCEATAEPVEAAGGAITS